MYSCVFVCVALNKIHSNKSLVHLLIERMEYGVQQYGHGVVYVLRIIVRMRQWESLTDDTNEIEQSTMVTGPSIIYTY